PMAPATSVTPAEPVASAPPVAPATSAAPAEPVASATSAVQIMRTEEEVAACVGARTSDSLFLFTFSFALDAFPTSRAHLLLSPEIAEILNGGPILLTGDGIPEDELQPPAPVRAALAIYSHD